MSVDVTGNIIIKDGFLFSCYFQLIGKGFFNKFKPFRQQLTECLEYLPSMFKKPVILLFDLIACRFVFG